MSGKGTPFMTHTLQLKKLHAKNQPDGMTVAEIQSRDDLPEEFPGLFGSQTALLHQVVKQLSSRHMLQYQVPASIREKQCDLKRSSLSCHRSN